MSVHWRETSHAEKTDPAMGGLNQNFAPLATVSLKREMGSSAHFWTAGTTYGAIVRELRETTPIQALPN